MTFKPGRLVSLYSEDGTKVSARPFFTYCRNPKSLICELFTDKGVPVHCVDEAAGLYALGDSDRKLRLQPPGP